MCKAEVQAYPRALFEPHEVLPGEVQSPVPGKEQPHASIYTEMGIQLESSFAGLVGPGGH